VRRSTGKPETHNGVRLSPAQQDALRKIASPGGHGFGSHAYLSRATAASLYRIGLIEVGNAGPDRRRSSVACITESGLAWLNACELADWQRWEDTARRLDLRPQGPFVPRTPEGSSLGRKPYAWSRWERWSDAHRARELRAKRHTTVEVTP
jgi:hypothetical protein